MKLFPSTLRLLAASLLAIGVVSSVSSPAYAHDALVSSTPEAETTLTELPDRFEITMNNDLPVVGDATGGFVLQIVGADGLYYGDGCVELAGATMSSAATLGPSGAYTMIWQLVSSDGHAVDGQIPFEWMPSSDQEVSEGYSAAPVCGVEPSAPASSEPTPTAEPSAGTDPAESSAPPVSEEDSSEAVSTDDSLATTLWIGGAVVVIAAAIVLTLVVRGRRKKA